jgi:DNA-binding IclR family transcriptional regulator
MASEPTAEEALGRLSSLEKGLGILRVLGSTTRGMLPAEIATAAELNRSTTYRLCEILERDGWVQRLPPDGGRANRFTIGASTLGLAILVTSAYDTTARLQPIINSLAASIGETVHVGVLEHTQIVHIAAATPPGGGLRIAAAIGSRDAAHATALGKALLATLSDEEVTERYRDTSLQQRTPHTIGTLSELLTELGRIRELGYSIDDEESGRGMKCVATSVLSPSGTARFALSVTTIPARLEGDRLDVAINATKASAALLGTAFGSPTL